MSATIEGSATNPLRRARSLKQALRRGELCTGAFLKIPSPDMVEVLAGAGMDFVVADAEHGPIDPEMCQQMARAADACAVPLLVRIGEAGNPATVTRFLDTGVAGVKLPRISTPLDAQRQIATLFHPPAGARGLAGGRWARYGAAAPLPELVRDLPASLVIAVQIEERAALVNLDTLLQLETPDVYFVGPTDLAASMGFAGDKNAPPVREAVNDTIERIVSAGRVAGVLASDPAEATRYVGLGARWIAFNGEGLVQLGARQALTAAREALHT